MGKKTSELTGIALDRAVAHALGAPDDGNGLPYYSTDWAQGGPILAQTSIEICQLDNGEWRAQLNAKGCGPYCRHYGPTPLIAAMRCYVASKLGDFIEIPEELT
jgi:Protein of unknown function (DUF2591)